MRQFTRWLIGAMALAVALLGMWRVMATSMSDHLASEGKVQAALEWNRDNPAALAALSRQQWERGDVDAASATARTLLQREPLDGQAFVLLAEIARTTSMDEQATTLSSIAVRRAPYALAPRGWLAGEQIKHGQFGAALENLDQILRISPARQTELFPVMFDLALSPAFANALAVMLSRQPTWREGFIASALASANLDQLAAILSAIKSSDQLSADATGRWIDRLANEGEWGEAYARWVGAMQRRSPGRLPAVYNGDFESPLGGSGFDWRIGDTAGVLVDRLVDTGSGPNYALRVKFLHRRVDAVPIRHWLLLGAGTYRLSLRASAKDLQSDRGVQWVIQCAGNGSELGASERFTGQFRWKNAEFLFEVPAHTCVAQELWLRNAGAAAAGKMIGGTILFDDFAIVRASGVATAK